MYMYGYMYIMQARLIGLYCHISQLCLNYNYGSSNMTSLDGVEYSLPLNPVKKARWLFKLFDP